MAKPTARRDPEAQHWLDEDVKNTEEIHRLEDQRDGLERALFPFIDAKPMPGSASDRYSIEVSGDALRAAKKAFDGQSEIDSTDPNDSAKRDRTKCGTGHPPKTEQENPLNMAEEKQVEKKRLLCRIGWHGPLHADRQERTDTCLSCGKVVKLYVWTPKHAWSRAVVRWWNR